MRQLIISLCAATCLFTACKSSRSLSSSKETKVTHANASTLYTALTTQDPYTWYSGKARIKANTPDARMSATMNLRVQHDSLIWATIDKFGFEVARVKITPDSVFIVDRLNKEYTAEAFAIFFAEYGVVLTFGDLQNTLVGRVVALDPVKMQLQSDQGLEMLSIRDRAGIHAIHWITQTLPLRLMKSDLTDVQGRRLVIQNDSWQGDGDGTEIPMSRLLTFEDPDGVTEIEIDFTQIERNVPVSTPFSIPDHYVRAR